MPSRPLFVTPPRADVESHVVAGGSIDGWEKTASTTVVAVPNSLGIFRPVDLHGDDVAMILAARPHLGWVTDEHPVGQTLERRLDPGFKRSGDLIRREMAASGLVPHWDAICRELMVGGQLVKQFCNPAPNQEAVLTAFQEEGWPHLILDPLPLHGDLDPKQRLHDTIKALNHCHLLRIIRFSGDGTGEGIVWRLVHDWR